MDGRDRVVCALRHREPDRVPFDLAATANSTIHRAAYTALRTHLGLPLVVPRMRGVVAQTAVIDADLADLLSVDARGVQAYFNPPVIDETESDFRFTDDYGVGWRMPHESALYYDLYLSPLRGDIDDHAIGTFPWPSPPSRDRLESMLLEIRQIQQVERRAAVAESCCSGLIETASLLRGYEDLYADIALNPQLVASILDRVLDQKLAYWEAALDVFGEDVDVVKEADDFAGQNGLLFSPEAWRRLLKPRLRDLFNLIRSKTNAAIFMHSCGSIRAVIPDLIDIGVQILNPVQVSAAGMDTRELKREFGQDIVFWGGGIDTQAVLAQGSREDVRSEVMRRLSDLMPGGGFVFSAVHNIQADVPPENVVAMWETVRELGIYDG